MMTSVNDSKSNDNDNENVNGILVVHGQVEISDHSPSEATTMMKLLAASTENVKQMKDSDNGSEALKEIDEKCLLGKQICCFLFILNIFMLKMED
uniref:Ovule protein n=1 Tax=Elaeophora elaphi TaxID=1147741 RepID=A0A0R3S7H6_9BILA